MFRLGGSREGERDEVVDLRGFFVDGDVDLLELEEGVAFGGDIVGSW